MPTETSNNLEEHSYSKVYRLLVNGEDDLVGQIAYAIYKQQKIEKITRFTTQNKRPPSDEELSSFMENAESETQRRFYNDRAVSILKEFLEQSLTAEVDEMNAQLKSEYDAKIKELLKDLKPKGFMYGVWQGVFASFIFFAAGILLLLATGGWARIGQALIQLAQ
ncbi:MAG: hypothetical protein IJU48_07305 [Synergistaceae bacterium]|nr:hypothetical protein [Synergistaceae bacterium]